VDSDTPWTSALITLLVQLWREGLPTGEIADRLGISKNAAIGKVHRLGLPPRDNPVDQEARRANAAATEAAAAGADGCRFPMWPHGAAPTFVYCGKQRLGVTEPYCSRHRKLCWVAPARSAVGGEQSATRSVVAGSRGSGSSAA
jgi:GcrA cell cycle regulator